MQPLPLSGRISPRLSTKQVITLDKALLSEAGKRVALQAEKETEILGELL